MKGTGQVYFTGFRLKNGLLSSSKSSLHFGKPKYHSC